MNPKGYVTIYQHNNLALRHQSESYRLNVITA